MLQFTEPIAIQVGLGKSIASPGELPCFHYVKSTFSIEMQELFVGYYDSTRKWNWWDCHLFEWDEAVNIAEWLNTWPGKDQLRVDYSKKIIRDLENPEEPFDIPGVNTATEDGDLVIYAIGTGWSVWEAIDE